MMATNLLQLIIRQTTNQKYTHNNRAYFSPAGARQLSDGVELRRGFFQSIRPTLGRILVNIDTTVAAFYQSGSLISVALSHLNLKNVREISLPPHDARFRQLEKYLHNVRINTTATKTRTKTIRGLIPFAGSFEFVKDGSTMTVEEYFQLTHNIRLQYPSIIGVRLSHTNAEFPVVVPAELCTVLPEQFFKKRLPNHLTAEVVKFATLKPEQRLEKIMGQAYRGTELESPIRGYAHSEYVVESGMQVDINPISVSGRMLPHPSLTFGKGDSLKPHNGAWNVVGHKFSDPRKLEKWVVVTFSDRFTTKNCEPIVQGLMHSCSTLGMTVHKPGLVTNGNGQEVGKSLDNACMEAAKRVGCDPGELQMVVVILPQRAEEIRITVKNWGDIIRGLRTNCMRDDKLRNANNQYYNNVALKLNARLGGVISTVRSGILGDLAKEPFMVMGADVSHPGPGTLRPSISSVIFSHDDTATRYAAITHAQLPRQEMIEDLEEMLISAINSFAVKHKRPPGKIIFYRDGISEGEFAEVGHAEIGKINAGIDKLWLKKKGPYAKPKLTYIVVGKRHHIAFFPNKESEAYDSRTGNCKPGFTTAAGELANPTVRDFYLQSHAAIQGTSRSSHYIVLRDEIFQGNQAQLQELSFALCHVYSKATRSVSIPAPVYYADLACGRAAFHYGPGANLQVDDSSVNGGTFTFDLESWKSIYKEVAARSRTTMYFL